jgi:cell division protein FtsI/penicillin-binding protein 2
MASAYTTLASGGIYWPARIVRKVVYNDGKVALQNPPKKLHRIYPVNVVKTLRDLLKQVVQRGTARRAKRGLVDISGKTGTAQKIVNGRYSHQHHIGVFVGMAPADKPEVCCLIMVDEPRGASYGGTVAAPGVADTLQRICLHLNVQEYYTSSTGATER